MMMSVSLLRRDISELSTIEAKFFLFHLCDLFEKENLSEQDPLYRQTVEIVKDLQKVFDASQDTLSADLDKLSQDYHALYRLLCVGCYSQNIKRAILQLCGFIAGLITGIICSVPFTVIWLVKNIKRYQLFDGTKYFVTGMLTACTVVTRFFQSFENKRDRQLLFTLAGLKMSFRSLQESKALENGLTIFEQERQNVIKEWFPELNEQEIEAKLKSQSSYQLIGFQAQFLSPKFKGILGHHSTLVIPIEVKGSPCIIELGSPSFEEVKQPDQCVRRECSVETLVQMMSMHRILYKQYDFKSENLKRLLSYQGGDNDCHTYVDFILASVGEELSPVKRSTETDYFLGKLTCSALQRYAIFPDKPGIKDRNINNRKETEEQEQSLFAFGSA